MRSRYYGFAIGMAAVLWVLGAIGAGRYDGVWTGGVSPGGRANNGPCIALDAMISIADGKIAGQYVTNGVTYKIEGPIAADGTVTERFGGNAMTGKFSGTHFEGSYPSPMCHVDGRIFFDKTK